MNQLEKFDKLCTQIYYWKGEFRFPFDGIQHNLKFESIIKDVDYPILRDKLKNLLVLINKDMTKINQETEELWEVI
jgi:hypothetical protein